MKVKDAMTKDVVVVLVDSTLGEVVKVLSESKISGAPVVDNGKMVGIISETDILKELGVKHLLFESSEEELSEIKGKIRNKGLTVESVMKKDVITIQENADLSEAGKIMNNSDVNRLPVLDSHNNLVGIISRGDIIRTLHRKLGVKMLEEGKHSMTMETDVDRLLALIDKRSAVTFDELAKQFNVTKEKIEEWGRILEDHGLVRMVYPAIGKPTIKSAKV